jgi:hypothetical protein
MAYEQGSRVTVPGPFGPATTASRSGYYVAPSGAIVRYGEQSGAVVGPLGDVRSGASSYVHAESADRGLTYSRYSHSPLSFGPTQSLAYRKAQAEALGPFGGPDYPPPPALPPEPPPDYSYPPGVLGPAEGVAVDQRSSSTYAGPFGMTTSGTRNSYYVAPSGATVQYAERSGSVVGPLGGTRSGSISYLHAESADHGVTYSTSRSHYGGVGPVGGVAVGGTMAVGVGPFGAVGYRRAGVIVGP